MVKKADEEENLDFKFIALWIAFNAAYADELSKEEAEHKVFRQFITRLCELDSEHLLYGIIWNEFPGAVKALLDTPYTFQPFGMHIMVSSWKRVEVNVCFSEEKSQFCF